MNYIIKVYFELFILLVIETYFFQVIYGKYFNNLISYIVLIAQ